MTALREHIGLAQASLWEISKCFDEADTAAERRASLQALCVQSEASLNRATAELKISKDQLGRVNADLKGKAAILQDLRDRSTAQLGQQIEQAQGQLAIVEDKINKARQAIIDTDASMSSLIKRLRIG